jgi:tRNA pseudouridine(38-40) synthase
LLLLLLLLPLLLLAAVQIHWMRAARTDKGVSAACQVVSAKLVVEPAETFVERVNALLPQQVS